MAVILERTPPLAIDEEQDAPLPYSRDIFRRLVAQYPDLRMEYTAEGEIIIMAPASSDTGLKNGELFGQVYVWNKQADLGCVFDSSAGFTLANGAEVAPDVSWIKKPRWEALSVDQRQSFAPLCPDLVVELRSPSDRLSVLQKKMRQYIASGACLGWLIDLRLRRVEIYRPGQIVEVLDAPSGLSGEDVLPGFVLDLKRIWG